MCDIFYRCSQTYTDFCNFSFQIPATTTRILLNHFKWDKEKLMERFYDGDQEKLFAEAHAINPCRKVPVITNTRSKNVMIICSSRGKRYSF